MIAYAVRSDGDTARCTGSCAGPAVRVGTDIVQVERVERLLAGRPDLRDVIFTPREVAYCEGRARAVQHLAARFAAKEAVLKALGTGLGPGMRWTDVEVVSGAGGRPQIRLAGAAADLARRRGVRDVDVSLTHSAGIAMASAAVTMAS